MNLYRRELYHHGILGMKWGKRQGPPYPLDASDHSAAEKKADYTKSIGGGRNESLYGKSSNTSLNKFGGSSVGSAAEGSNKKKLTGTQKAMIAVGSALAAKSIKDTATNAAIANAALDGVAKISTKTIVTKGAVAAGAAAAAGALATYGAIKAGQFAKNKIPSSYRESIVSTQKQKLPGGVIMDGYQKQKSPQEKIQDTIDRSNKKAKEAVKEAAIDYVKNKRLSKKEKREYKNEVYNKGNEHDTSFDNTPEGKELKSNYRKEMSKMERDYDNPVYGTKNDPFAKAEEKYLRSQQRYTANKLLGEYGVDGLKRFLEYDLNRSINTTNPNELVKMYENEMWSRHTY